MAMISVQCLEERPRASQRCYYVWFLRVTGGQLLSNSEALA